MNRPLVALGVTAIVTGLYSLCYPQGRYVRNWISPKRWQENPEEAAEEQAEWAGLVGATVFLGGCVMLLAGLLA